jgi:hypothetical protein
MNIGENIGFLSKLSLGEPDERPSKRQRQHQKEEDPE